MTCRSMKKAPLMRVRRIVLGTHGIVRTEHSKVESTLHYFRNLPAQLNQSSQGTFCVGCAGVQENAISNLREGIYPLPDRTCRVPTSQRHRGEQEVREGVHHQVCQIRSLTVRACVLLTPCFEAESKLHCAVTHAFSAQPRLDGLLVELQKDPFTLVLKGRQPGNLSRQGRPLHPDIQLAFSIRCSRFKPGEANLCDNLPKAVY